MKIIIEVPENFSPLAAILETRNAFMQVDFTDVSNKMQTLEVKFDSKAVGLIAIPNKSENVYFNPVTELPEKDADVILYFKDQLAPVVGEFIHNSGFWITVQRDEGETRSYMPDVKTILGWCELPNFKTA